MPGRDTRVWALLTGRERLALKGMEWRMMQQDTGCPPPVSDFCVCTCLTCTHTLPTSVILDGNPGFGNLLGVNLLDTLFLWAMMVFLFVWERMLALLLLLTWGHWVRSREWPLSNSD